MPDLRLIEAILHNVQRREFFSHEKHSLPLRERRRDDVRNRLTLARARRALDDQRFAA